jgi:inner membrane protein
MDNLTHSLTGALTAKFIESRPTSPEEKVSYRRTFFWLFVAAANLPDIDVILGLVYDPINSIRYHRGITHSLLFAPLLAFLPSVLFFLFGRVKNIRILWIVSLLGIVLHIFFDLVTSFGTQILLPISERRYSLDWMFIIDPVFTCTIGVFLLAGRFLSTRRSRIMSIGIAVAALYVIGTAVNHGIALTRVQEAAARSGVSWNRISVLPQPLSIFSWHGLVQFDGGVMQTFFSLFKDELPEFTTFMQSQDGFAQRARAEPDAEWFLTFARHPLVEVHSKEDGRVVEFRDLMFSINEDLTRSFGFTERFMPFVLAYTYDLNGNVVEVRFDGEKVETRGRDE